MGIIYHEKTKTWHLTNAYISYIFRVMENGQLENLYYGAKIHDRENFLYLHEECQRAQMSICMPDPSALSMFYTKQEYPIWGTGDYRSPATEILQENGSRITNFVYDNHVIYAGKKSLLPLPATYVEDVSEADTLEITLKDSLTDMSLILSYSIYRDYPVITRNTRFINNNITPVILLNAMSTCIEFNDMDFSMLQLSGAWSRERYVKTRKLEMGIQSIGGTMGTCSSAEQNPFIALLRPDTDEFHGEVYGFNLVYSGNFLAQTEVSTMDQTRVMLGIHPQGFSWKLGEGEEFQTPECVMVYSKDGLNSMSQTLHRLYRTRLSRGKWRDTPRPILLNNWEATYFDFNEEKLLGIAAKAKEAGVELFVLDDGWFGTRNNDRAGLGDWFVNIEKLPSGISGLSEKIEKMGLRFGLWFELEMANKDSDLYRAHPDWIIHVPDRFESHSRHQYVLDFSRPEVVDYIHDLVFKILSTSKISYIKWDMNRYMTEPWSVSLDSSRQGELMHRYILGVYTLYERLRTEFPDILFESCASGGARFDPGLLFFAPQAWCSDDTDAYERQKIQYGTSYAYPIVMMGSHVSAVPNHQMRRTTPIETRGNVAYFGTFGYELDLNLLSEEEMAVVRRQIEFMKTHRELLQIDGDFYRLKSPFEGNDTAWMVVSQDKTAAVAGFYQRLNKINASWLRLRLAGLDPDKKYCVTCDMSPAVEIPEDHRPQQAPEELHGTWLFKETFYGDELMHAGLVIPRQALSLKGGDFASLLFELKQTEL